MGAPHSGTLRGAGTPGMASEGPRAEGCTEGGGGGWGEGACRARGRGPPCPSCQDPRFPSPFRTGPPKPHSAPRRNTSSGRGGVRPTQGHTRRRDRTQGLRADIPAVLSTTCSPASAGGEGGWDTDVPQGPERGRPHPSSQPAAAGDIGMRHPGTHVTFQSDDDTGDTPSGQRSGWQGDGRVTEKGCGQVWAVSTWHGGLRLTSELAARDVLRMPWS